MKKFIFRNPFITKSNKVMAYKYITMAEKNLEIADRWCKQKDGAYDEQEIKLIVQSTEWFGLAARYLGFRNIKDMDNYKKKYGRL